MDHDAHRAFLRLRRLLRKALILNAWIKSLPALPAPLFTAEVLRQRAALPMTPPTDRYRSAPATFQTACNDLPVLSRLYPPDYRAVCDSLLHDYQETRAWFFTSPLYLTWLRGAAWTLCCHGAPRCGKSSFAAAVARNIKDRRSGQPSPSSTVINIFLGHGWPSSLLPHASAAQLLLRAILRQLVEDGSASGEAIEQLTRTPDLHLHHLRSIVLQNITRYTSVFLIVDGLDSVVSELEQREIEDEVFLLRESARGTIRLMYTQTPLDVIDSAIPVCDADEGRCGRPSALYWRCSSCLDEPFLVCYVCYDKGLRCAYESHIFAQPYSSRHVALDTPRDDLVQYVEHVLARHLPRSRLSRLLGSADLALNKVSKSIVERAGTVFVTGKILTDFLVRRQSVTEAIDVSDRLPLHQRQYFDSLMHDILGQTQAADRSMGVAALALFAACSKACFEAVSLDFNELQVAISQLTADRSASITSRRLLRVTKGFLSIQCCTNEAGTNVTHVLDAFHPDGLIFMTEECREVFADLQPKINRLDLPELFSAVATALARSDQRTDHDIAMQPWHECDATVDVPAPLLVKQIDIPKCLDQLEKDLQPVVDITEVDELPPASLAAIATAQA